MKINEEMRLVALMTQIDHLRSKLNDIVYRSQSPAGSAPILGHNQEVLKIFYSMMFCFREAGVELPDNLDSMIKCIEVLEL